VIAHALPETPIPDLSSPTRTAIAHLDDESRTAAIQVRFAAGSFQNEDVEDMVSLILKQDLSKQKQNRILNNTIASLLKTTETAKAERAIVAMMSTLKTVPSSDSKLMRALNTVVRRRHSNLADPSIWTKLGLPAELLQTHDA
jgi:hypothetical protein